MSLELRQLRKICALAMYQANASRTEIMVLVGCGHDSVRQWARSANLPAKARYAERDPDAIDRALATFHEDLAKLEAQQSEQAKRQAKAKRVAKLQGLQRRQADAKHKAQARAAEARTKRGEQPRGYVCTADCACLLCQLGEPNDSSRRTDVFALRHF